MNNKVKFLRGTATEYESSTKDNDTFYYTTDDEKLYLGNKEITGGGVTVDDTLSDTSVNPVQNKVVYSALSGKASSSHTHDSRYYTESEIDAKLSGKMDNSVKGIAGGVAELDSSGKVPAAQLPSSITLGETSSTAYRGDRGKIAYDHSQSAHAPANAEANVQSDWNVTNSSSDAYIKNKPTKLSEFTNDAGFITSGEIEGGVTYSLSKDGSTIKLIGSDGTTSSVTDSNDNTKNTAGSTNTSSKIFLVGATTQATSPTTYSHDTVYVGTDGCVYSNSKKVVTTDDTRLSDARTPVSHNHKSNEVDAMTGYSKPTSTSAIATSDTLNTAIGKLEKALDGKANSSHTHSEYTNQNAFSNVVVGSTTVAADTTTDTLTLAGSNVTITPDTTNDKITIGITKANVTSALGYTPPTSDTTYSNATTSTAGLMSPDDKKKLEGIATGATKVTVDSSLSSSSTNPVQNKVITTALNAKANSSHTHSAYVNQNAFSNFKVGSTTVVADTTTDTLTLVGSNVTLTPDATNDKITIGITKSNVTSALGYTPPTSDTTYNNATTTVAGLMSAADKEKLDGIAKGANNYSLPTASSTTLGGVKTTSSVSSNSGYTACPIISGVPYYKDTKVTVDSSLSSTSTNPVQNKIVKNALDTKVESSTLTAHTSNTDIHVTSSEKSSWNSKAELSDIPTTLPANGGNADTVGGKHANDFSQIINLGNTSTDTKTAIGIQGKTTTYWCSSWTDYPAGLYDGQGMIIAAHYNSYGTTVGVDNIWCRQIFITPHPNTKIYQRILSDTDVGDWVNIADGGNAATVGNKSIEDLMSYGMAFGDRTSEPHQITSGDLNNYHTAGCFLVPNATSARAIANSPFTNSGYFLDIYSRNSSITLQIAFIWGWGKGFDKSVIKIRSSTATSWSEWKTINTEIAGDLASTPTNACLRNIYAGTSDMTAGTTALATGTIYLVYE